MSKLFVNKGELANIMYVKGSADTAKSIVGAIMDTFQGQQIDRDELISAIQTVVDFESLVYDRMLDGMKDRMTPEERDILTGNPYA